MSICRRRARYWISRSRSSALAASGLAQWLANSGTTMTFPIRLTSIGLTGTYGICAAVSMPFVWRPVHGTPSRALEDIVG